VSESVPRCSVILAPLRNLELYQASGPEADRCPPAFSPDRRDDNRPTNQAYFFRPVTVA
jgi:hypothetical protein